MDKETAKNIVNAIFNELEGRSGFDVLNEVRDNDAPTYTEMHATCIERVLCAANGLVGEFDHQWNPEKEE